MVYQFLAYNFILLLTFSSRMPISDLGPSLLTFLFLVMRLKLVEFGTKISHKYLQVSEAAGRVWVSMRIVQGSPLVSYKS